MLSEHLLNQIGCTAYEAVRVWDSMNDMGDKPAWKKAGAEVQKAVIERVKTILSDPRAGDATFHNKWLNEMKTEGWSAGKLFDEARKIDPLMVAFHLLPNHVQARERLFRAVTISLSRV